MRVFQSILPLLALAALAPAQENPGVAEEPPAWKLSAGERRKLDRLLRDYLQPGRRARLEMLPALEKWAARNMRGHSPLEDVAAFEESANRHRRFSKRAGKPGVVSLVEVPPEVHGFPGGFGTVRYHVYLPTGYDIRNLHPLLFCMPDNKVWPDGRKYIEEVWTKRSQKVADTYVIAVPTPNTKAESWDTPKSFGRAMLTLRHVAGHYDASKMTGGPAVDLRRIFLDGGEMGAQVAARFAELFSGVVLRDCAGEIGNRPNLRSIGGVAALPAYCVYDGKKPDQKVFAEKLRATNESSQLVAAEEERFLGDAEAIAAWMEKCPVRTQPREIAYTVHRPSFHRQHWINVRAVDPGVKPAPHYHAVADRARNEVTIYITGIKRFDLFLNDALVDLNRELRIVIDEDEQEFEFLKGKAQRNFGVLLEELVDSNHPWRVYPVRFVIDMKEVREIQARKDAEEARKRAEAEDEGLDEDEEDDDEEDDDEEDDDGG